jgi:hypothetical protein
MDASDDGECGEEVAGRNSRYPGCEGCLIVVSWMAAEPLALALTLTLGAALLRGLIAWRQRKSKSKKQE